MNKFTIQIKDMTPATARAWRAATQLHKFNQQAELNRLKQNSERIRQEMLACAAR